MESVVAGKNAAKSTGKIQLATQVGQKKQTNPGKHSKFFFESSPQTIKFKITALHKSKGNQSHKGSGLQEALILFNVTVLGSSLVSSFAGSC